MRKTIAAAVASLVALSACAPMRTLTGGTPFDPRNPKVYVVESKDRKTKSVVVDQEPIYFFREDGRKIQIRWQLQSRNYRFDTTKGIADIKTLYGPVGQVHSCHVEAGSKDEAFVCTNENTASGLYKYTIHVVATDGSGDPRPLDPLVGND
jgi:hypothetical protein